MSPIVALRNMDWGSGILKKKLIPDPESRGHKAPHLQHWLTDGSLGFLGE